MAKRTSRNGEGIPNKRARTADDFDDLWGDDLDLDEDVIDDCFKLATQVLEQVTISNFLFSQEKLGNCLLEKHHMYAAKQCFYFAFL